MFDWREFQDVAEYLADTKQHQLPQEAAKRAAISRAYYACFGKIRNIERDDRSFEVTGKAEDHGKLFRHLKTIGKKASADNLARLREWRNDADYKDEVENLNTLCDQAIQLAKQLIDRH